MAKFVFLRYGSFSEKFCFKKEAPSNAEYAQAHTYVFHELTISRYFIVFVRKINLWRLTLARSAVGTGCEL